MFVQEQFTYEKFFLTGIKTAKEIREKKMVYRRNAILFTSLLANCLFSSQAFVTHPSISTNSKSAFARAFQQKSQLRLTPLSIDPELTSYTSNIFYGFSSTVGANAESSTSFLISASDESWRQYVPLIVSCFVIVDILLGSPAANLVMKPLREGSVAGDSTGPGGIKRSREEEKKRERVDSDAIAKAALERASNSKELRDYLERTKTEADKMQEMRRQIDKQIADFENNK